LLIKNNVMMEIISMETAALPYVSLNLDFDALTLRLNVHQFAEILLSPVKNVRTKTTFQMMDAR